MEKQINIPKLRFSAFKEEWGMKKLGEVATINPSNKTLPDKFIYIDLESVSNGILLKENLISKTEAPSRAQRILKENDVLFQMVRPYQMNNLFFNKIGDFVASTGYAQIRTLQNPMYIFQYLHFQKFVDKVIERCTGTSYPSINSSDLSNITISFPSLPEQTQIASFLSSVDKKLSQLKQKKNLLEQYKKGVMQKLFSQELRFKDENGNEFPKWEKKQLGEVTNYVDYRGRAPIKTENGIFLVTAKNIKKGFIDYDCSKEFVSKTNYNNVMSKGLPQIGDILFTTEAPMGNVAQVDRVEIALAQRVIKFRSKELLSNSYLLHFMLSDSFQNKIAQKSIGTTVQGISGKELHKITITIPCIKEQTKIANFLSALDNKINHCQLQIEKTENWKKGLLQQLFV